MYIARCVMSKFEQRATFLPAFLKSYYTFATNKLGVPNFQAEIIPFIPDQDNTCVGK
jgi:hypothetical protein